MKQLICKFKAITLINLGITLALFAWSAKSFARPPEESELLAAGHLAEDMAEWIRDLEVQPASIGIFSVHANPPLEQDFAQIVETNLIRTLAEKGFPNVSSCAECRSPNVTVQDDKIIVARGAPDIEHMKKIGKTQSVSSFLIIEIYRTNLSLFAQATLYENPSGKVLGAERFKVTALNFKDASVQVLLQLGSGKALSGKGSGTAGFLTSANLLLLEELGFAKGGLNVGGIFGGANLFYLNPTIGFRGRFGSSVMSYGIHFGVGYGLASESRGISMRGAYELHLGTLAILGAELTYFIKDKSSATPLTCYAGFHVGIALGR
jgi:hypothetical protein